MFKQGITKNISLAFYAGKPLGDGKNNLKRKLLSARALKRFVNKRKKPAIEKPSRLCFPAPLDFLFKPGKNEGGFEKGARFLVLFLVLSALAYALLAFTPVKTFLGWTAAHSSQFVLRLAGVETQTGILENGNYFMEGEGFLAELNDACAALIEIAVLFGIVFASFEKTVRERAKGFAAGTLLLLFLNPIRISLSLLFIDPFVHEVLFRVTLIIVIVGFYAAWHYGAGLKKILKRSARG